VIASPDLVPVHTRTRERIALMLQEAPPTKLKKKGLPGCPSRISTHLLETKRPLGPIRVIIGTTRLLLCRLAGNGVRGE
jgi:hypothetical protein